MNIEPCFYFQGQCEQAMDFYREALSAEVLSIVRLKDSPNRQFVRPGTEDKIFRAVLKIGEDTLLVSDGHNAGKPSFQGMSINLTLDDPAKAARLFGALAEGGEIRIPLQPSGGNAAFGTVADQFGVLWVVSAAA